MSQPELVPLRQQTTQQPHPQDGLAQPATGITVPEKPALAPNVELVGRMQDTGFAGQQWLIARNGQFLQVTELLYRVAELADGERSLDDIAVALTQVLGKGVTAEHVRLLIQKLMPLGLIVDPNSPVTIDEPGAGRGKTSPLGVNMRARVVGAETIERAARVLQILYAPPIVISVLIAAAAMLVWLFGSHGLQAAWLDIAREPALLVLVLLVMVLAGFFHELGHATALRYGGARARGMGVGFYLIYPAFYTDTTDGYRLGRWARVRTDLGGFYFYLIFALAITYVYFLTHQEFLLLAVALISLDIAYQMLPFVRLDGYWALADLTGIPDWFTLMGPFLASILPLKIGTGAKLPPLKPWVRRVFLVYTALTIPVLLAFYFLMIRNLPQFLGASWDALVGHVKLLPLAWEARSWLALGVLAVDVLLVALTAFGILYVIVTAARAVARGLWGWSRPAPGRRVAAVVMAAGLVFGIARLWAPQMSYLSLAPPAGVQNFQIASRQHVDGPVSYPQSPPAGGDHSPVWQNCGFYSQPVRDENAVHSMEHGAVWITYSPELPAAQAAVLRQLAAQQYVLASPHSQLAAPVVATAWGHELPLQSANDPRLAQFVRFYRLSKEAPEAGGPCSGGIGVPQ